MNHLKQILNRFKEFSEYLDSINLEELRSHYTRQELKEFSNQLYSLKMRSLAYEVNEIVEKMKLEEYPQLLGVHHFPILKEIDFLTEEQKIELDKYLVKFRVGEFLNGLKRVIKDETKRKKLKAWLLENGVVEDQYYLLCPHCHDGYISGVFTNREKIELDKAFKRYKESDEYEDYEKVRKYITYICMECEEEAYIDEITELSYKVMYKMKMERDKSLDNV